MVKRLLKQWWLLLSIDKRVVHVGVAIVRVHVVRRVDLGCSV